MRKHYLDNIRWITVVLVLIYHVFYMFNAAGVLGGVGSFTETQYQDVILYFVYPWFMVLLFVLSGMSAKLALDKKANREFIRSRTLKLLVPSTLGLFAFQWIVGYFNVTAGGGMSQIPSFLRYPIMVLPGIGPLWFIQMLWLFSHDNIMDKVQKNSHSGVDCGDCRRNCLYIVLFRNELHLRRLPEEYIHESLSLDCRSRCFGMRQSMAE